MIWVKGKGKKRKKHFFEGLKALEAAIVIIQKYEDLLSNPTPETIK